MARPTHSYKHKLQEILESPSGIEKFKRMMAATTKPEIYLAYFKECVDRAHGRATQPLQHSGEVGSKLMFIFPEDK